MSTLEQFTAEIVDAINEAEVDEYAEQVSLAISNATMDGRQTPAEAIDIIDSFTVALEAVRAGLEADVKQHEADQDDLDSMPDDD